MSKRLFTSQISRFELLTPSPKSTAPSIRGVVFIRNVAAPESSLEAFDCSRLWELSSNEEIAIRLPTTNVNPTDKKELLSSCNHLQEGDNTSGPSSRSSPSEIGDSGVSSESDTPPLSVRKPCSGRIGSSDSDNDSNMSSDSLRESIRPNMDDGVRDRSFPMEIKLEGTEFQRNQKQGDHGVKKLEKKNYSLSSKARRKLPEDLLREIKAKYEELKARGKFMKVFPVGGTRIHFCHNSVKYSHTSLDLPRKLRQSTPSLPATILEARNRLPSILHFEDSNDLFECRDDAASEGFAGISDIFSPHQLSTIMSSKGTVRGVKNRVRAGIAAFTSDQRFLKYFVELERGKVVVYVTTLGVVRDTYDKCLRVRKILWTLLVQFDERDVFMSRDNQIQILDRLQTNRVTVPHVFVEGQYLGSVDFLEKLNETGALRQLMLPYVRPVGELPCDTCGGFRFLPCGLCCGSKKSLHRSNFCLKCSSCDESGLVSCSRCN